MMTGAIFLSASVPDPAAANFVGEGDSAAIASAVSALLQVVVGRRQLVWGGHPAITPMVWAFAEAMNVDYGAWVKLYQSSFFEDEFPEENSLFQNVVYTNAGQSRELSLAFMRQTMVDQNNFDAAVFIGGMAGIIEEYELFQAKAPGARIVPVASTGGAARLVADRCKASAALRSGRDYVALLYSELSVDPRERRYRTPAEQPTSLAHRLN